MLETEFIPPFAPANIQIADTIFVLMPKCKELELCKYYIQLAHIPILSLYSLPLFLPNSFSTFKFSEQRKKHCQKWLAAYYF